MVDLNISVLKDAADAIDKVVDAVRKFAELIGDAAGKGSDVIQWHAARGLKKKLRGIHSRTTTLWIGQRARLGSTLADFIADPKKEDWRIVQQALSGTLGEVQSIAAVLKGDAEQLSTLPFYKDLALALAEREVVLSAVLKLKPPQTANELVAVKLFLQKYAILVEELGGLNDALARYIRRLQSDGKWPIRGD